MGSNQKSIYADVFVEESCELITFFFCLRHNEEFYCTELKYGGIYVFGL
jgi:hypothetical protein